MVLVHTIACSPQLCLPSPPFYFLPAFVYPLQPFFNPPHICLPSTALLPFPPFPFLPHICLPNPLLPSIPTYAYNPLICLSYYICLPNFAFPSPFAHPPHHCLPSPNFNFLACSANLPCIGRNILCVPLPLISLFTKTLSTLYP